MSEPERSGNRLLDACIGILVGAIALWGAVHLIEAIWVPLTITVAAIVTVGGIGWYITSRNRRW